MDLKQYVSDAIRTESKIEQVKTNKAAVLKILDVIIAAGTMLDQFKKNTFYNKPFDTLKFDQQVREIHHAALQLSPLSNIKHLTDDEYRLPTDLNPRLYHALVGAITESAEIAEALRGTMISGVDPVNILEEFGDINWYEAIAVDELNGDFQQLLERNIAKLKARFPNKFTSEDAINRDLKTERNILEGNVDSSSNNV